MSEKTCPPLNPGHLLRDEAPDILHFVRDVEAGASIKGRWLDHTGAAIDGATSEDDPPETEDGQRATWERYTQEETEAWLEGIAAQARAIIAKAEGRE